MKLVVFEVSCFLRCITVTGRTKVFDPDIAVALLPIEYCECEMKVRLLLFGRWTHRQVFLHIRLILLNVRYHWKSFMPGIRMLLLLQHMER